MLYFFAIQSINCCVKSFLSDYRWLLSCRCCSRTVSNISHEVRVTINTINQDVIFACCLSGLYTSKSAHIIDAEECCKVIISC